jgi:hypothetical protein
VKLALESDQVYRPVPYYAELQLLAPIRLEEDADEG